MPTLKIGGADLSFTGGKWTSAPSGTILQTVTATMREDQTVSATSWTDVTDGTYPLSVTLTPSSTSNYLLCIAHIHCGQRDDTTPSFAFDINGTKTQTHAANSSREAATFGAGYCNIGSSPADTYNYGLNRYQVVSMNIKYEPATTSACTVKVQAFDADDGGNGFYINRTLANNSSGNYADAVSTMTVHEVAG